MRRFKASLWLVLLALSSAPSWALVKIFPVPAEMRTDKFTVKIDGHQAALAHAASNYYFLSFDLAGSAKISITAAQPDYWKRGVEVQPWRMNVRPAVHGNTITFTLRHPAKLSITRPGDHFSDGEMLFLFADTPETNVPKPDAAGVRYYGPGVYHGDIDVRSGETIYLAGGAVVFGGLNLWQVENVRVRGRGVIVYDGPQDPNTDEGWMHRRGWHAIVMDNARNIEIDGITCVVRSRTWMIQMRDSRHVGFNDVKVIGGNPSDANQDGIDWLGGGDTAVRNSFIRAADDVFAMQGNWEGYSQEAMLTPGHDVSNITIEDSVVSTSISNIVRLGWPQKIFNSSNFLMRNVDVMHMGYGSCGIPFALFEVWADPAGKGQHANYRFENIRLEDWYSLVQLRQPNPEVRNVSMSDVWAIETSSLTPSVLAGDVRDVSMSGVQIAGKVAIRDGDIPLQARAGAEPVNFLVGNGGLQASFDYSSGVLTPLRPVTFEAAASPYDAQGAAYEWFFGDGQRGKGRIVRHAFPDAMGTLQDGSGRFRVLLKITDAQGHSAWTARPVVVAANAHASEKALPALAQRLNYQGLAYRTLGSHSSDGTHGDGVDGAGADLQQASVVATGEVESLRAPLQQHGATQVVYDGFLKVPADGGYTFTLRSAERSTLVIDGQTVAIIPRPRPLVCGTLGDAAQATTGSAALRAGMHRIHVWTDTTKSGPNESGPSLEWQGPGILLSEVPDSALFRSAEP